MGLSLLCALQWSGIVVDSSCTWQPVTWLRHVRSILRKQSLRAAHDVASFIWSAVAKAAVVLTEVSGTHRHIRLTSTLFVLGIATHPQQLTAQCPAHLPTQSPRHLTTTKEVALGEVLPLGSRFNWQLFGLVVAFQTLCELR